MAGREAIPSEILYGYRRYALKGCADLSDDLHGHFSAERGKIVFGSESPPLTQLDTVLHECGHMILAESRIPIADELEEQIVSVLGSGLTQLFVRNPALLRWIQDQIKHA